MRCAAAVRPDTILLSIMLANNEVGTVQPLQEAVALARGQNEDIIVHTDAVQAAGCMELDVEELDIDLMSIAAHKFYGPKGIGALYMRRGTPLIPLVQGGGQERNRRSGTENVPYVIGMAKALTLSQTDRDERSAHCQALRDRLTERHLRADRDCRTHRSSDPAAAARRQRHVCQH